MDHSFPFPSNATIGQPQASSCDDFSDPAKGDLAGRSCRHLHVALIRITLPFLVRDEPSSFFILKFSLYVPRMDAESVDTLWIFVAFHSSFYL